MAAVREDVVQIGFDIDMGELTRLTSALDKLKNSLTGGVGEDAFDEMVKESKKATEGIDDVRESMKNIKPDGMDDAVKGLKDTGTKAEDATSKLKKLGNVSFAGTLSGLGKILSQLGHIAVQAGKVLAKGIAAGAAAVGAVVGKAVSNFADYEQLVGGVDTLFKGASGTVQQYAAGAYKTAGLSANSYMETVTSFSASLIQSLGGDTAKAAEYAHTAIVDMSDNANKMGTNIGSIQDAYQGFAKQNYTMLDNLKLGYGGTQAEMARLINDSGVLGDAVKVTAETVKDVPFAKIVEAIHQVQEEIGITGTTAAEADKTISGSLASLKAAWSNTLTALVIGGDTLDQCIDNLVEAAKTFGKNIMPAIQKALEGVGELITELAPVIEKELPTMIDTLLPPLIKAATALVKGLIIALPDIISTLVGELPSILQQVWEGINEAFGEVPGIKKVKGFFDKLSTLITENAGTIKKLVPALLGLVAAFKLFNKFKGITSLFGGGGKGAGGGLFSTLANMQPKVALKGIANLAVILAGLGALAAVVMWVSPYLAKLSDLRSVGELLAVIAAVGLVGTAMSKLAGMVGNIPAATVDKGVANIAVSMLAMGALAAVLMWVSPYLAQLSDLKSVGEVVAVIAAVGIVGAGLSALAGVVGAIPTAVVTTGLANIALVLGGFTAVVAAFGALNKIDGLSDFLDGGGEILTQLCGILGEMAGSIVGGFAEGVTNSLAGIGENISAFADSVEPGITKLAGMNFEGLGSFATSFGKFVAVMTGTEIASWFTGGIDYAQLGTDLSTFMTNGADFFTAMQTIPEAAFTNMSKMFDALSGIKGLPKDGGITQWFSGTVSFASIAAGLQSLSSEGMVKAFTTFSQIPEAAFTGLSKMFTTMAGIEQLPKDGGVVQWFSGTVSFAKISAGLQSLASAGMVKALTTISQLPEAAYTGLTKMFETLAGIKQLPKDGGVVQWFGGTVSFVKISTGLQTLTSAPMLAALTAISQLPETTFSGLTSLFDALAGVKSIPKEGGIFGWFTGDASTGLTSVASKLPGVATNIAKFFTNLGGRTDFTPIKSLFDTLSSIKISSDAAEGTGLFGMGASALESMGTGLANFATNAAPFFTAINGLNLANMKGFFTTLSTGANLPATLMTLNTSLGTQLTLMVTTVRTKLAQIKSSITTNMTSCVKVVSDKASEFQQAGKDCMSGLNQGMLDMLPTLLATATSIGEQIAAALNAALKINSPSRVTMETGVGVGEGVDVGMKKMIPTLQSTAVDVAMASVPYAGSYSPDNDSSVVYNSGGNSEYTTISPVFNLTVSGTTDDRAMARKIQRYVADGIQNTFESLGRKNRLLREV